MFYYYTGNNYQYSNIDLILTLVMVAAVLIAIWAQFNVSSTFNKYSKLYTVNGRTAAETARRILDQNGLSYIRIERVPGNLTDHYDPRSNVLRLSESTYDNTSAAAIGVAAHEAGHAIQHAVGYFPIKVRQKLAPAAGFASRASMIFILLGLVIFPMLAYIGVILYSVTTLFQLVTLPCEFNASARALSIMETSGWYSGEELRAASKVLRAAALTYVAATLMSALYLLRYLLIIFGGRRRNR